MDSTLDLRCSVRAHKTLGACLVFGLRLHT
jgi:hypothetical protein